MAFKIDLTKAHPWPATLDRTLDIDGAFRFAAILAAMRVIAPVMPGDGFARHFEDATYPPDFATADKYAVDAYRAMAALFAWDGGSAGVGEHKPDPHGWCEYKAVTPGQLVFTDVIPRGAVGSASPYEIERAAARRCEVYSCLASAFPYRYWWQAFNRAMATLMDAWPFGDFSSELTRCEERHPEGYPGETSSDVEYVYEYATAQLFTLPYVLGESPTGVPAKQMHELLTGWLPHDEAAAHIVIQPKDAWLMTGNDIDVSGVFRNEQRDWRSHDLRDLWTGYAAEVGFSQYLSPDYTPSDLWSLRDGLKTYWRGETSAKYAKEPDNRLAQLAADWDGATDVWRDEFPYHGFAAMLAYLDYFEQKNIGFVVATGPYSSDAEPSPFDRPYKVPELLTTTIRSFSTGELYTGLNLSNREMTVDLTADVLVEGERKKHKSYSADIPTVIKHVGKPTYSVDSGFLEVYVDSFRPFYAELSPIPGSKWTFFSTDENPGFFAGYLDSGGSIISYVRTKLEELLTANTVDVHETPVTIRASSQTELSMPDLGYFPWALDWLAPTLSDLDPATTPYFGDHGSLGSDVIYFLKTTQSSRIAKAPDHGLYAQLRAEAGVPSSGALEPLDIGTESTPVATLQLNPRAIFVVDVIAGKTMVIEDYRNNKGNIVEVPLVSISIQKTGDSQAQLFFPPATESPDAFLEFNEAIGGSFALGRIVGGVTDNNTYATSYGYSRLEKLRQMQFVRYPERVIYPQ